MNLSKAAFRNFIIVALLASCSSSKDVSMDEGGDYLDVEAGGEMGMGDDQLLSEISGQSPSNDFDSTDFGDSSGGVDQSSNPYGSGVSGNSYSDTTSTQSSFSDSSAYPQSSTTFSSRRSRMGSGERSWISFTNAEGSGVSMPSLNWQIGYGDNKIRFGCRFNKRSPLRQQEDRFGCVITESGVNTVIHVHESTETEVPVLNKVTIDMKGNEVHDLWEKNLRDAGYIHHKDSQWRAGLTAKRFMSRDHMTHVYLVWNANESAATLIFRATSKGMGKEISPVAYNND